MADPQDRWFPSRPVYRLPGDLLGVVVLVGLTVLAVFLPGVRETPLRLVLGLPFLLFLPGYAFVAALFPEKGPSVPAERRNVESDGIAGTVDRIRGRSIGGVVRVALSFGASIAIVTLVGLALDLTPWGIRPMPVMVAVGGFTVGSTIVALQRRWAVPEDERFVVPYRTWYAVARNELLRPETRVDAVLNGILITSLLLAVAGVGYAVSVPQGGDGYTEFYLLTEDENGDLVADGYPTALEAGNRTPIVLGVTNQEREPVEYTIVVQLQRVTIDETGNETTVSVTEVDELDRVQTRLAHSETWRETYQIQPSMTGENLRLTFLLYKGDPPAEPTIDNAYREVHLWINVSEP